MAETNERSLAAHADDIELLNRHGRGRKNDLLAAQVSLANAKLKVIQARNALEIARSAYNRRLQRPLSAPVHLAEPASIGVIGQDLATLSSLAIQRRPEIHHLTARIQALHSQAEVIFADKRPQVEVAGGFDYRENRYETPNGISTVGVRIGWNFYDGGRVRRGADSLRAQAQALVNLRADLESRIHLQVRQAWLDVEEAKARLNVTEGAIDRANENLRVARQRYNLARATYTEVLDAESLRAESDRNHAHAHYDAILAALRLRRAIGGF